MLRPGGSGGDLGAEVVGAAVLKEGRWGSRLAGEEGEERAAGRLGWVPAANYDSLGCQYRCQPSSKDAWGLVGVGEAREAGKVRGTDRLEKSTCSPRVHPPFRYKLSGRKCGCRHSNSSSS